MATPVMWREVLWMARPSGGDGEAEREATAPSVPTRFVAVVFIVSVVDCTLRHGECELKSESTANTTCLEGAAAMMVRSSNGHPPRWRGAVAVIVCDGEEEEQP